MSVNFDYYKTFYYVATYGSMGKAAQHLYLTPPSVTKAIKALEEQLSCLLFIRSAKGVLLTPEGEVLFEKVKPAVNLLMLGEQEIEMLYSLEKGSVSIGITEFVADHFLIPTVLKPLHERYPNLKIKLVHTSSIAIEEELRSRELDFAVLPYNRKSHHTLEAISIYSYSIIPIVGKEYAFLVKDRIPFKTLAQYPLILTPYVASNRPHLVGSYLKSLYEEIGIKFEPHLVVPSITMQLRAVEQGLGFSFVPSLYAKEGIDNGSLFLVNLTDADYITLSTCILKASEIPLSRAAQELVKIILDKAPEYSQNSTYLKTSNNS